MRIINTARNAKRKTQNAKLQFKIKNFSFCITVFLFTFYILHLMAGCGQKVDLDDTQKAIRLSRDYYQQAISDYKKLIAQGEDLDNLYRQLGELYYSHGDFSQAADALKKSSGEQAKKLLAIAHYRLGKFSDALEVFHQQESDDPEYLYYYGLTSEKLNLFDKALAAYQKITAGEFRALAKERRQVITKETKPLKIKDISPQSAKIIASAPPAEKYPQAGALILACNEKVEITPQNTEISSFHYLVKILNERGKEDFSETKIEYDSTFEKVELEYARTIKPDGTVVEVGLRHIRDVSKYMNFPLYSNARVFIISFPEVANGACIEYKARVYRSELINKKDFVLSYPVQSSEPIIQADFLLDIPEDKTIRLKTINEKYNDFGAGLKPASRQKEGRKIYSWNFLDIPQIIPESNMPPAAEINPVILISTFNSWQEIYQWWWNLAKDKISIDAAIKAKVKELIKKENSPEGKARVIYNFCAKDIRYVAVEYGQAGYEPHQAADIFRNKYGDCKDQAILLVAMLKEAGVSAWPVLIPTREAFDLQEDFPSMQFDHCIAALQLEGELIFLDPTAETCSFQDLPAGDQDRGVFICRQDGFAIARTPLFAPEHNLIRQALIIKINNDESITAERKVFTDGVYEQSQRYWLLYTPPQLIEEALKEKIQDISIGAKLLGYRVENAEDLNRPVLLEYSFSGPEYLTVAGGLRIMPQLAGLDTAMVAKDKRRYPLFFGTPEVKEVTNEIEISGGFIFKYLPEGFIEDNPWAKFVVEYYAKKNKLIVKQMVEWKKEIIAQEEYPGFKAFVEETARKIKQRVILEKTD